MAIDTPLALNSWGSFLVLLIGGTIILYLAREPAHRALHAVFHGLYGGFRLAAKALQKTCSSVAARNRDVLLCQGREQAERDLEKEFFEINKFVQHDLGGYPQLQRRIQEQVAQIQDDYECSREAPVSEPDWLEAVESIAKLKGGDKATAVGGKILEQIHSSAEQQHKENLAAYRKESGTRHRILKTMTPFWRKLAYSVDEVGDRLKEIITRSQHIDTHMARFNDIIAGTDRAERALKASAITQFLIASLVIAIAVGGAFFNFHLIALPMSEMVGSVERVGGVKVANLAALVIICLEVTAGIFLLESLRITKLFPLIGSMDDRIRRTIMITAAIVLVVLASTESALAFMRDQIAGDLASLRASLAGVESDAAATTPTISQWIPLAANMILGFILPLALTMVAIPLEYLLQTGRNVIGSLLEILLSVLATLLRILANIMRQLGRMVISFYDLLIAAPLWIESQVRRRKTTIKNDYDPVAEFTTTQDQ
ncbi:hypothetical protein [Teredinibacter haidensis]|uniref:hypothetical protein n=1 Tax=Teredinibacter haidensis TaxID=2731755 RepID=UPI000948B675|nr:hypothetical protein [Teredinibacter haidensis]